MATNRLFCVRPTNLWEADVVHPQRDDQPWTDEIVAEVRSAREQLFAACDYDLEKLADRLRQAQKASGRAAVTFPRRMPAKKVPA